MDAPEQNGLQWIKATKSYGSAACIELARSGPMIALRDSKNPGTHFLYTDNEFDAFLDGAKRGEFDHLLPAE